MNELIGVVPAAGRGTRAYPYTKGIPKCMLDVAGEPNLARILAIFRDQLGIKKVVIVTGDHAKVIRDHFGDGSRFGVSITWVENDAIDKGLSYSILCAKPHVGECFVIILGDECYIQSNHEELLTNGFHEALATCAVLDQPAPEQVLKNYAVEVEGGLVRRLIEKPKHLSSYSLLGLGTFLFHRDIFGHLEAALANPALGPTDPVSVLGRLVRDGHRVRPFYLKGSYVNINDRDELNLATYLRRTRNFESNRLGLALLARGLREDPLRAVHEFAGLGRFSEIVLVLDPTQPVPALEACGGARVVVAASGEFGTMMRTGLEALSSDILFTAYADGSCTPADVPKFLEYLKDADVVVGTRTTRQLVHQGANMRGIVRFAHVAMALILDLVWWGYEPHFTDTGCSFRAMWRSSWQLIRPRLSENGPAFAVEMLLETLQCRRRVIEIPVSFSVRRKGRHKPEQRVAAAWSLLSLIVRRRLRSLSA
jgi:dTDP-glucose pyrophosphorylase